ncbi:Cyclopropane fatty acid synthase [Hordeum vulgare]|nr:Cyclopropane fatty acid synthase [Hordeum vulgare]
MEFHGPTFQAPGTRPERMYPAGVIVENELRVWAMSRWRGGQEFAGLFLRALYHHLPVGTPQMFTIDESRMGGTGMIVRFRNPYDAYHLLSHEQQGPEEQGSNGGGTMEHSRSDKGLRFGSQNLFQPVPFQPEQAILQKITGTASSRLGHERRRTGAIDPCFATTITLGDSPHSAPRNASAREVDGDSSPEESRLLWSSQVARPRSKCSSGVCRDIYLHRDDTLMPQNPSAWSSWNFLGTTSSGVCVTYWLNLLQNVKSTGRPFLVTLNPSHVPDRVMLKWNTGHPVLSVSAAKASLELQQIQGNRGIWFCGEYQDGLRLDYTGYGVHEDGLKAGKSAAQGLLGQKSSLLVNPKQMVPSWTEAGARLVVTRFRKQYVTIGNMTILEEGGTIFSFGEVDKKCLVKTVLRVHDPLFYWKVATEADLGMAHAYLNGYFSFVDKREGLLNLFLILIANRDAQKSSNSAASKRGWWTPMLLTAGIASAKYFLRHISRKNIVTQTRRNISRHYDLSNDFFSLFLDPSMTYSCAVFKVEDESLEVAQQRKVNLLIKKAKVERNHHVLEIGSGWGSLAMQVVKQTGCKYTGITLSEEQLKYAEIKVKEAGLEFISIPEERYEEYRRSSDFIKEYIFPGGCLPSLARITSAMSAASRLCIEQVENIGYHYYPTLIRWRDNFMAKKDAILALGFDDKFIRVWEYYFIYCAAGFKSRTLGTYQIVFSQPGNDKLAYADNHNPYASLPAA